MRRRIPMSMRGPYPRGWVCRAQAAPAILASSLLSVLDRGYQLGGIGSAVVNAAVVLELLAAAELVALGVQDLHVAVVLPRGLRGVVLELHAVASRIELPDEVGNARGVVVPPASVHVGGELQGERRAIRGIKLVKRVVVVVSAHSCRPH